MTDTQTPVVVTTPKPWRESRTLWLNLIAAVLIALQASFNLFQPLVPGNVYAWFAALLPIANAALRVITTSPLVMGAGK